MADNVVQPVTGVPWRRLATRLRDMPRRRAVGWGLAGTLVMALCSHAVGANRSRGGVLQSLGVTNLSFGHIAGILEVVLWCAVLAFIVSWAVVGGRILRRGERLGRGTVAAWTLPFLIAGPLMSRDVYSYLMQGQLTRDGLNPYEVGASADPGRLFFEVSPDWRNTTTPYGPLHLWLGEGITRLSGENITAGIFLYKLLSLASLLVMAWAVARLARALGMNPDVAVWLGVTNPVVIIHLVAGMHNEGTMMAFVMCGLLAATRLPVIRGAALGALLIGLGIALKATAFIALPFLVWITVARHCSGDAALVAALRRRPWRTLVRDAVTFSGRRFGALVVAGLGSLAVAVAGIAAVTWASGLSWGWIGEISGNNKVINPLSLPSTLAGVLDRPVNVFSEDLHFNNVLDVLRPASLVVMVLVMAASWFLWRRTVRDAMVGATVAYAATCVFNSVVFPWYYSSPLALVGLWLRDRRGIFTVAWLSMIASFTFGGGGNNKLYNIPWVIAVCLLMWWICRSCLDAGFRTLPTPATPADTPAPQDAAGDPAPTGSADGERLGAPHDLTGEVPVEGVDRPSGQ
jgi:alpha-1,6-mannosyltransferase